jgi:hypothetical protein
MRFLLPLLFLIILMNVSARGENASISANDSPLKIEAFLDENSLNSDYYKKQGVFVIHTKITNTSDDIQKVTIWNLSGGWLSSSDKIMPGMAPSQNFPTEKTLQPHESYEQKVTMVTKPQDNKQSVTFRIGFVSHEQYPVSRLENAQKFGGIYWSNSVTLTK